jgi:hypothetical protein
MKAPENRQYWADQLAVYEKSKSSPEVAEILGHPVVCLCQTREDAKKVADKLQQLYQDAYIEDDNPILYKDAYETSKKDYFFLIGLLRQAMDMLERVCVDMPSITNFLKEWGGLRNKG